MQPKHFMRSRTLWANAIVATGGILVALADIFGTLAHLGALDLTVLPDGLAAWVGGIIAFIGAANGILRLVTGTPIKGTPTHRSQWKNALEPAEEVTK